MGISHALRVLVRSTTVVGTVMLGLAATVLSASAADRPEPSRTVVSGHHGSGRAATPELRGLIQSRTTQTVDLLNQLRDRSGPADPRYYAGGIWHDGSDLCFRCTMGPGVLSAAQAVTTGDKLARVQAIQSFTLAIRQHQRRSGAVVPPAAGEDGPGIQTAFFVSDLANAYVLLRSHLDAHQKALWRRALERGARYLVRSGMSTFYVNGNINLLTTSDLDVVARITGSAELKRAARASARFLINPPSRWSSFGLRYTMAPTASDGSDGSAYLSESGGSTPGFDPAYTLVQSNFAARWFMLTGSPVAKRLTNLLLNQLWPRVDTTNWTVDVSGGTRRPSSVSPGTRYAFSTSALPVLALWGGRSDLYPYVASQSAATWAVYQAATSVVQDTLSGGYGFEPAMTLQSLALRPTRGGLRRSLSLWK